eukprot:TRINITY_DN1845_c0_g1_i1.p1 TRINITY_DN1845_c0_g1~~TRINITY_DN1845_c0_g1_i1.p1  ORF type:complete len:164 (-),score=28.98 TRINITY_DN1845_c0_g1_i1:289-780(-)
MPMGIIPMPGLNYLDEIRETISNHCSGNTKILMQYGAIPTPTQDSLECIENYLKRYIQDLITLSKEEAQQRNVQKISPNDIICCLHKDEHKLKQCKEYFATRSDPKHNQSNSESGANTSNNSAESTSSSNTYSYSRQSRMYRKLFEALHTGFNNFVERRSAAA